MFDGLRKNRRRRSMRKRRGKSNARRTRKTNYNLVPILKIAGIVVAVAGLACLVIFLIVPWIKGDAIIEPEPTPTVAPTIAPTPSPTSIAKDEMSADVNELEIEHKSINDPYIFGNEIVFSTGALIQSQPDLNIIAVYDITTKTTTEVPGITIINTSLFEPKINENYIVYLDCKSEYGGKVMGYDRATSTTFVMREYWFGMPKVSLVGDYALWMQQTGTATDKLYLYHLSTKESTVIEVFVNTPFSISAPYMSKDEIIYVQPHGESQLLDGSSASMDAEIVVMPLSENGDKEAILFLPGTFVYNPMIAGEFIVYLDGSGDIDSQLMFCQKNGDSYSLPKMITDGILNYDVGDGYVVYTKDDAIYIYYFADESTGRLSSSATRGILSSANGKEVVWYDITDGFDSGVNVIQHITVP